MRYIFAGVLTGLLSACASTIQNTETKKHFKLFNRFVDPTNQPGEPCSPLADLARDDMDILNPVVELMAECHKLVDSNPEYQIRANYLAVRRVIYGWSLEAAHKEDTKNARLE